MSKNSVRKIVSAILILVLVSGLCGCENGNRKKNDEFLLLDYILMPMGDFQEELEIKECTIFIGKNAVGNTENVDKEYKLTEAQIGVFYKELKCVDFYFNNDVVKTTDGINIEMIITNEYDEERIVHLFSQRIIIYNGDVVDIERPAFSALIIIDKEPYWEAIHKAIE